MASRFLPSEWQSKKKVVKFANSFGVSTGGNADQHLANFATFFFDCHSDGKNLEAMCSFGREFVLNFDFYFCLNNLGFNKRLFDMFLTYFGCAVFKSSHVIYIYIDD